MNLTVALFACALLALSTAQAPAAPVSISGTPGIVDGDTLRLQGTRIRLIGIDAPEKSQSCMKPDGTQWQCGQEAAKKLQAFIAGRQVSFRVISGIDMAGCW